LANGIDVPAAEARIREFQLANTVLAPATLPHPSAPPAADLDDTLALDRAEAELGRRQREADTMQRDLERRERQRMERELMLELEAAGDDAAAKRLGEEARRRVVRVVREA